MTTFGEPWDQVTAAQSIGGVLYAMGVDGNSGPIWRSLDASTWTKPLQYPFVPDDPFPPQIHDLAGSNAGLVAAGARYPIDGASPVLWFSPGGDAWIDVTPTTHECMPLHAVTATDTMFVAVGGQTNAPDYATHRATAFTSNDGQSWTAAERQTSLEDLTLLDVVWTGSDLIATSGEGFFLHSADGATWSRQQARSAEDGYVRQMAYADGQVVGVGLVHTGPEHYGAAVYRYIPGGDWERVFQGDDGTVMNAVVWDGGEWMALGEGGTPGVSPTEILLWKSEDGVTWGPPEVVVSSGQLGAQAIAVLSDRIMIFGRLPTMDDDRAAWVPMLLTTEQGS